MAIRAHYRSVRALCETAVSDDRLIPRSRRGQSHEWRASQRSSRPADQARVALDSETQGVEAADQQRVAAVDVTVSAIAAPGRGVPTVATIPTGGIGTNAVATRRAGLCVATGCERIADAANRGEPTITTITTI